MENTICDVYMAFYHPLGHQTQRREVYRQIPEHATRR
jgi:hypothetical protein